jgi:hypothetical protein
MSALPLSVPRLEDQEKQLDIGQRVAGVARMVGSLGSAERVADFLLRRGVHGVRCDVAACPLSVYLGQRTGVRVSVTARRLRVHGPQGAFNVEIPVAFQAFVTAFGSGAYPELEFGSGTPQAS